MEVHATPWSNVIRMMEGGEIQDAKTLVALLYAAKFRAIGRG